jgi:hypothetical protein
VNAKELPSDEGGRGRKTSRLRSRSRSPSTSNSGPEVVNPDRAAVDEETRSEDPWRRQSVELRSSARTSRPRMEDRLELVGGHPDGAAEKHRSWADSDREPAFPRRPWRSFVGAAARACLVSLHHIGEAARVPRRRPRVLQPHLEGVLDTDDLRERAASETPAARSSRTRLSRTSLTMSRSIARRRQRFVWRAVRPIGRAGSAFRRASRSDSRGHLESSVWRRIM